MGEKMKKSKFEVLGMCCASEAALVESILKPLDGVKHFSVIVPTKTVTVVHDTELISKSQVVGALNKARLEASLRIEGETNDEKKWPDIITLACGLLLVLSFLKYIYQPFDWLALASVAIGFPRVLFRAIASIRALSLNINILVLISVCATTALQDFWEGGVIIFLFSIAQWLETRATHKAMVAMSSLMSMAPQKAVVADSGEHVDVNEVKINTIVAVKAGEAVPVDGVVVQGKCEVDEKMLTGEAFPVTKECDSLVWAGTINLNGYIGVKTTVLAKDTVVARMSKLVEEAHSRKSRAQRFIDHFAKYYIPVVVMISAGIAVVPAALGVHDIEPWFHLAIVVLLSACPCALILSTPVAIFCALTKAATTGLLLKGGDYLETLSGIKTVAFDKTGTITRGEFTVSDFCPVVDYISNETLLYWVSSIESKSSHPMAAALMEYGILHSIKPLTENVEDFQNFPGEGVFGKIDGKNIYIGNRRIGVRAGCEGDPVFQNKEERNGYIYCGPTLIGVFSLVDTCRSGALEAIEQLKSLGVRSVMLTGDTTQAAMNVETRLNHALDNVHAELLPAEKAVIIENLKKDGLIAMIGDGVNDAPALATADIGISMGISGSALAIETGNAILMSNDIRKIPEAIILARKTTRKLIENVIVSIGTKCAVLALAIAGYPIIWLAVLTDVGTCLLVILNSMLILQDKSKHEKGSKRSKYNTFLGDLSKTLLDKQRDVEEQQGLLDAVKFGEVHAVKSCNDCCIEKAAMREDSSCSENKSSDCCRLLNEAKDDNITTMESAGNKAKSVDISELPETNSSTKCCEKGCCNNLVKDVSNLGLQEIVIE